MTNYLKTTEHYDENTFEYEVEKLYIGPNANYTILMPFENLELVNKVFDKIIKQHGYRNVSFEYIFGSTNTNYLAKIILPAPSNSSTPNAAS